MTVLDTQSLLENFYTVVKLYSDRLEVVVWSLYILSSELGVLDRRTCSTKPEYEGFSSVQFSFKIPLNTKIFQTYTIC